MKELIQVHKLLYPDLIEMMRKRYDILYTIDMFNPIGRRGLVEHTTFQERFVRNEVAILKNQGLVIVTTRGMETTEEGKKVIESLRLFIKELDGLTTLEKELQRITRIKKVILVPGDSDQASFIKQELGRATVRYLQEVIRQDVTIAVTGGTTMAAVAEAMRPLEGLKCTFVPARGGVGEKVENQANTIVAQMAKAEKGDYRLLHVPDPLSEALYQTLIEEPSIKETLPYIKNSAYVLHGVGDALIMANRRKTSQQVLKKLTAQKAVGEAFGYYFNKAGEVVHKVRTIGIHLEDLDQAKVITVAGGKSKAHAIASFMKQQKSSVLISDEAAAHEMIEKRLV